MADEVNENSRVWMNTLWPIYDAIASSMDTVFLWKPTYRPPPSLVPGRLAQWNDVRRHGGALRKQVAEQLNPSGPNVLMVSAGGARDVYWSSALYPLWSKFSHRVLHIFDQLNFEYLPPDFFNRFDLITCLCEDLAEKYRAQFNVPVLFWPTHMNVLKFHSTSDFRPIDMILVGRRDNETFIPLHRHFNAIGRNTLFLDFVTRTQVKIGGEDEFRLLFSTYAKSKLALCFEPGRLARFRGHSQLTGRWTHSWAAGCTVVGRAPTGTGVREQMDWPEATLELPSDPDGAIAMVEALLADEAALRRRRQRNVLESLRRHDTRYRLRDVLEHLDLPLPPALEDGLTSLKAAEHAVELNMGTNRTDVEETIST